MSLRLFGRRLVLQHCFLLGLLAFGLGGCSSNAPAPGTGTTGAGSSGAAGPSKGEAKRIILLTNGDDPFWDTCFRGMQQAEVELKLADAGFKVVIDKVEGGAKSVINAYKLIASAKPELLTSKEGLLEVTDAAILLSKAASMDLPEPAPPVTKSR